MALRPKEVDVDPWQRFGPRPEVPVYRPIEDDLKVDIPSREGFDQHSFFRPNAGAYHSYGRAM